MKNMIVVFGVLLCSAWSGVQAGTLTRTKAWAEKAKPEAVRTRLTQVGAGSDEDFGKIVPGWEEEVLVALALERNRIDLLAFVLERDPLSEGSVAQVLTQQRGLERPHEALWTFVARLPKAQRGAFEGLLVKLIPVRYADRPVYGALDLKYQVLRGERPVSQQTDTADLVTLLLAPERLELSGAEHLKEAIKWNAVRLARTQLRDEGLSFVAIDGVNPLERRMRPVVEALNAPMCAGIEEALRGLGADVKNQDRSGMQQNTSAWRERILLGDMNTQEAGSVLGRLAIALGVGGFNEFVDVYNHGERGAVRESK